MRRIAVLGFVLAGMVACAPAPSPSSEAPARVVFFTPWSADLDDAAQGVVSDAAQAAQAAPGKPVLVEGYADFAVGSAQANQDLTRLRTQHIADGLTQRGVAPSRIVLRPRNASAGGDPGLENRRVVIEIGS